MNTTKADRTLIVIPARLQSNRLPNKPLLMHKGKTLLDYTYEQAKKTKAGMVVVATSDQGIMDYCADKNMDWVQTPDCPNGSARCFHAYTQYIDKGYEWVIDWQVDEPLINSVFVNFMIGFMHKHEYMAYTAIAPITEKQNQDPNVVKAIVSDPSFTIGVSYRDCFWFTRTPIRAMGHCGIYGFSINVLWNIFNYRQTEASKEEKLEQLSWIEGGVSLTGIEMRELPLSINTPEDWTQFCNEN